MAEKIYKVRTPIFPLYSTVRCLVKLFDGTLRSTVMGMINAISEQTGTPQNPVDWSEPDIWINERLAGDQAELARRIWEESGRTVNPRHIYGAYLFINTFDLLRSDNARIYRLTDRGRGFIEGDKDVTRELDDLEGIAKLLEILATKPRAKSSDLIPEWGEFLQDVSKFGTASTFKDTLRRRLVNMMERGLVSRDGVYYTVTKTGLDYLESLPRAEVDLRRDVIRTMAEFNQKQRETLWQRLSKMHSYRFEQLVRDLLEAMGYEDVIVTKESGDMGVDVVATVQFGITTLTEVVQVKKQKGNIQRSILDQLRGSLPYHKAIRGTIITIGGFSSGCKDAALYPGAAPIGLIDGKKLLDLLMEHEIGIKKRPATLYEIDEEMFEETKDVIVEQVVLDE
ncbi:MAG: restriction endonuclease [Bacteroidota bacterium]